MTSKPRSCFDAPRAADTVEYDFNITLSPRELEHRRSRRTHRLPAPVATATPVETGSHDNFSSSSSEEFQMFFSLGALRKLLLETPPAEAPPDEDELHDIANQPSAPYSVHRGYTCDFEEPVKPAHWQRLAATNRVPGFPAATPGHVFDAEDDLHKIANEPSAPCGGIHGGKPPLGQRAADSDSTLMPSRDSSGAAAAMPGHVFDVVMFAATDGEGEEAGAIDVMISQSLSFHIPGAELAKVRRIESERFDEERQQQSA
jgi:hypothetical protein